MSDRLDVARMNVAICEALGIDPAGVVSMVVKVQKDERPEITVTYSAGYIAELEMPGLPRTWIYELSPAIDREMELAAPANGSDWVPPTLVNAPISDVAQGAHPRPEALGDHPQARGWLDSWSGNPADLT